MNVQIEICGQKLSVTCYYEPFAPAVIDGPWDCASEAEGELEIHTIHQGKEDLTWLLDTSLFDEIFKNVRDELEG